MIALWVLVGVVLWFALGVSMITLVEGVLFAWRELRTNNYRGSCIDE